MSDLETNEKKSLIYRLWDLTVYAFSVISVTTFMFHFWAIDTASFSVANTDPLTAVYPLWGVSGAFAIFAVFSGIIRRSEIKDDPTKRGMVTAAAVIGCLVLLGLTISATMLMVPLHLNFSV